MNNNLTEAEAKKLFNSVSDALGDPNKLDALLSVENTAPAAVEPPAVVVPTEEPATTPEKADDKELGSVNVPVPVEPAPPEPAAPVAVDAEEVEVLRRQLKLMEHKRKSDEGRVAAFQKKANELETKLAELSKSAKPPSAADASEDTEDEELLLLKRADPTLYRILKKREDANKQELARIREEVRLELAPARQTATSGADTGYDAHEVGKLKTAIPNISDVVNSEPFKVYREAVASPAVASLLNSKSADDVIQGIQLYSSWLVREGFVKAAQDTAGTTPESTAPNAAALRVKQERERKLETSVNVASPSSLPVKKELTEQELFDEVYTKVINRNQVKK